MHVFGSNELIEDVHQRGLCIGCGACVDLCPYFENYKGKTAQLFPCTLEQGRCYAYCPKAEVDLNELVHQIHGVAYDGSPLGHYRAVMAARAGDKMPGGNVQGGGTVTALMTFALRNGLVHAAALTDRQSLNPIARLVTDWKEVVDNAGAKFMASPTLSALNIAVKEGYDRIGVVGTPCQMTAVAQMRRNPLVKEVHKVPVALSIGLFCNWSLDTRQLMNLLADKLDPVEIRKMDIPPPPADAMIFETDSGGHEVALSDIKPLIPHTCFICMDLTSELADLAVGMFEGKPGWNTVIIRSEAGEQLVEQARIEGYIVNDEFPAENLKHLSKAAAEKKDRSLRTLLRRGLINNENGERAAVRIPPQVVKKILK